MVAGGTYDGTSVATVNVYSPDGKCNYELAPLPLSIREQILFTVLNQIFLCFGANEQTATANQKCWKFNILRNEWLLVTASNFNQYRSHLFVYQDKLYVLNDQKGRSEIYDPVSNTWSIWANNPPSAIGGYACVIQYKDGFFLFGGENIKLMVQFYSFTTNSWKNLAPMAVFHSGAGCVILPQNQSQVLVLSTYYTLDMTRCPSYTFLSLQEGARIENILFAI